MMKKLLAMLLALMLILSMAACGGGEEAPENGNEGQEAGQEQGSEEAGGEVISEGWLKTRTGRFYSQFDGELYMEYETSFEGMTMSVVTATKGEKTYSESKVDGVSAGISIIDGDTMYAIDHASKMVMKMNLAATGQEMTTTLVEESDIDPANLVEGKKEIDGKTYDTEEWVMDGAKSIFCFDGDDLAYMIGEAEGMEMVMKILKTSDKVDEKLFEIPADYQVMEF